MSIRDFFSKKTVKKTPQKSSVSFSRLSKTDQEKILKKGAKHFSKKFTKVIVKLTNE